MTNLSFIKSLSPCELHGPLSRRHQGLSRPQSRLARLAAGDWARGPMTLVLVPSRRRLRGPSGSGDENAPGLEDMTENYN